MLDIKRRDTRPREQALAEAIGEVVSELRLVDVVDYVAFLRLDRHGNIADIVSSSAELTMKPGVLRYAGSGDVSLTWGTIPVISLALEFRYDGVTAHFRLELGAAAAAVDITFVDFEDAADGSGPIAASASEDDTRRLLRAVDAARLRRREPVGHA